MKIMLFILLSKKHKKCFLHLCFIPLSIKSLNGAGLSPALPPYYQMHVNYYFSLIFNMQMTVRGCPLID